MRARNIKPGFFKCCELAEIDFASRLLFIGLWCYADREGRFEWKPKKIKAEIFPYDNVNVDKLLCNLMSLHFITRNDSVGYVENFKKHQSPHPHEAKSTLPEKTEQNQCHDMSLTSREMSLTCRADVLIPDSLIPDNNLSASGDAVGAECLVTKKGRKLTGKRLIAFNEFWEAFDYKKGKAEAADAWHDILNLTPTLAAEIVAAAGREAAVRPGQILNGKTPKMAQGWLTARRWEDEVIVPQPSARRQVEFVL